MNEKHEENGVIYVSIFVMQTTLNLKLCIQSNLYKKLHFEKRIYWKLELLLFPFVELGPFGLGFENVPFC